VQAAAALGIAAVSARELGPSGRGTVAVVIALVALLVQLGHLGLASSNSYFAARRPELIPSILVNSLWFTLLVTTCVGLLTTLVQWWEPTVLADVGWRALAITIAVLPAALLVALLQGVLLGQGRMLEYNLPLAVAAAASFLALALFSALLDLSVEAVLVIAMMSWLLAAPAYVRFVKDSVSTRARPDLAVGRAMVGYSARIYAATLVSFLLIRIDLFLVNALLGPREAGLYSVAVALGDSLVLLPVAVGLALFSHVAKGLDIDATPRVFRPMLIAYSLICALAVVLAGPLIRTVFGATFSNATELFVWLAPGVFSLGLATVLSYHFAANGYPLEASLHWLAGLVLNLGVNLLFLEKEGLYIAPLASSLAYTLVLVLHIQLFSRQRGNWSWVLPRGADVRMLLRRLA
jgi:O-antigen/teichoic acid export membrane protein